MKRALVSAFVALVLAFFSTRAAYAQRVDINATVDNDTVEVGDGITYSVQVMAHGGPAPSDPKPGPIPGFSLHGTSSAPIHMRTTVNGAIDEVNGLVTQWALRANKVGSFTLGPAIVIVGGTSCRVCWSVPTGKRASWHGSFPGTRAL